MHTDTRLTPRRLITSHRRVQSAVSAVAALALLIAGTSTASPAVADSTGNLRAAVSSARSASCGPLRSNPVVEKAAEQVNRTTDVWLDQNGRAAPVDDPLPLLKDLGYGGKKAVQHQGAGVTEAKAIKGLLLETYLDFSDCSYTDYGVSAKKNRTTDFTLLVLVLARA